MTLLPFKLDKGDRIKKGKVIWQIIRKKPAENRIGEHIYWVRRYKKAKGIPIVSVLNTERDILTSGYVKCN